MTPSSNPDRKGALTYGWTGWRIAIALSVTFALAATAAIIIDVLGGSAAAVAGFIGTLATAVIAVVGLLVKSSIDLRTADLAEKAEERMNVEAAITALGLIGAHRAHQHSPRVDAAVLSLAHLGQISLALSLAETLWRHGELSPSAGVEVVSQALTSGTEQERLWAAHLLFGRSRALFDDETQEWHLPQVLLGPAWDFAEWPTEARSLVLDALAVSVPETIRAGTWLHHDFTLLLHSVMEQDPDQDLRAEAAQRLRALLPLYRDSQGIAVRGQRVTVEAVRSAVGETLVGYSGGERDGVKAQCEAVATAIADRLGSAP